MHNGQILMANGEKYTNLQMYLRKHKPFPRDQELGIGEKCFKNAGVLL